MSISSLGSNDTTLMKSIFNEILNCVVIDNKDLTKGVDVRSLGACSSVCRLWCQNLGPLLDIVFEMRVPMLQQESMPEPTWGLSSCNYFPCF
jgi:hypothetical protein